MKLSRRLVAVTVMGVGVVAAGVGFATLSDAEPKVPLPPAAAEHYFDAISHRGPHGEMMVDTKVPIVGHVGSDGKLILNSDGSTKLFPLDDGSRPPTPPGAS